jgi:hypothetical protein
MRPLIYLAAAAAGAVAGAAIAHRAQQRRIEALERRVEQLAEKARQWDDMSGRVSGAVEGMRNRNMQFYGETRTETLAREALIEKEQKDQDE